MMKKLEDVEFIDCDGNELVRRPNNDDIIRKINEIIEFLDAQPTSTNE